VLVWFILQSEIRSIIKVPIHIIKDGNTNGSMLTTPTLRKMTTNMLKSQKTLKKLFLYSLLGSEISLIDGFQDFKVSGKEETDL